MKRKFHEDPPSFYLTLSDSEIAERYGKQAVKQIDAIKRYINASQRPAKIESVGAAYKTLRPLIANGEIERFAVCYINNANQPIETCLHSIGGQTSTVVDIKRLIKKALQLNAKGMIIAHNHPSGSLTPSEADIKITKKISDACKFFDLVLLDHLIITSEDYFSFEEKNLIK